MRVCLLALLACLALAAPSLFAAEPNTSAADEQILRSAKLSTDGKELLEYFRKRTLAETTREKVAALIAQLGSDEFALREQASSDLVALGTTAVPLLRQAVNHEDVEIAHRAEKCLEALEATAGPAVSAAAIRIVARQKPEGASETLLAYLPFAEDETVIDDVRAALAALAVRNDRPDSAIQEALSDKLPLRRGAAAQALVRTDRPELLALGSKLLTDPDATVRLQVALALFDAKKKESVPALIHLLGDLPRDKTWQIEDILYRVAADEAPEVPSGDDRASRTGRVEGWGKWWKTNEAKIDLTKLDSTERLLGYTMVFSMDRNGLNGKVEELGPDGKPRWEIPNLQYPVDAQIVGSERVLVAEYRGKMVTERDFKGNIKWQYAVTYPIACQRLPNGNTFISTRYDTVEVDKEGKEVARTPRRSDYIVAAQKLRNGDIAFVNSQGKLVRTDAEGKELKSFPVGSVYSYGCIDVQPNGRVLVPLYSANRVVEFDAEGKQIWEASVQYPTSVARLPNGNILVTSLTNQSVIELDRKGKEVWTYRPDGRPMGAKRR